ncbi:MAG TPA: glycosyltransferase family 39 protein, partial [candidate division Zixibacteria bacterium]|nr:glycosyltransferase family 39 protein [candidate division Zixibacteria bacterium]
MSSNAADGGEAVQPETPADSTQSKFLPWAKKHQDLIALLFLTVLALIPRLYRLSSAPPGLNADELFNAVDAISLGPGNWQIYFEGNFGRESLFLYLMAIPLKLFGQEIWALRLPAVLLGTGTVLLAYLIGKQAFNRRIGFIAGALIAVSLWPIMQSRWGLRAVSLTFFTALTVYLYGRLLNHEGRGIGGWLAAGFALGLTMYTYIPARLFPLVIAGWLLWLSILDTGWLRRQWPKIVLSLGVALLVFAPFGLYMIRYPDKFDQRVSGLWETVENKLEGDPDSLLERVVSVPLMFTFQGDTEGRYHVPERPVFDPLTSLFFYLGVGVSLWLAFRKGG